MHSIWHRLNSLLTYGSTVLLAVCILTSATDFLVHKSNPVVSVKPAKIEAVSRGPEGDWAWMSVDLDADLSSVFSWNTKQLFVSVMASFSTPKNHINEAVIWTDIITDKAKAHIQHVSLPPQWAYTLSAQDYALRGTPFNLTVSWDVMPIVGALYMQQRSFSGFQFPSEYFKPPRPGRLKQQKPPGQIPGAIV
ncbi:hypothetical protein WJX74_004034 [Apatococcus lobatus]|uniref:Signal peptidase complex subunit 3 n=1 Tax=Apatococcus lobatus TaxID=904363 RepID=A0AAW1SEX6_9CHLO